MAYSVCMKVLEVKCVTAAHDPADTGIGMRETVRAGTPDLPGASSVRIEVTDAGVICTGKRMVFIPWSNVRSMVVEQAPAPAAAAPAQRARA